jgi:hypothetical protein
MSAEARGEQVMTRLRNRRLGVQDPGVLSGRESKMRSADSAARAWRATYAPAADDGLTDPGIRRIDQPEVSERSVTRAQARGRRSRSAPRSMVGTYPATFAIRPTKLFPRTAGSPARCSPRARPPAFRLAGKLAGTSDNLC